MENSIIVKTSPRLVLQQFCIDGVPAIPHCFALACVFLILLLLPCLSQAKQNTDIAATDPLLLGKQIYEKGILPNGQLLTALGKDGLPYKINRTACIDCHRRSGLGTSESGLLILPITGEYLFKKSSKTGKTLLDNVGIPRPIYTEKTLKTVIRTGIRPDGKPLHEIMPRYKLSDTELDYLIAYLKSLDKKHIPGLTDKQIDFATVITPGMSIQDKKLMLRIIKSYYGHINKDVRQLGHMRNPLHGRYKPYRKWKLHIWNLTGEQKTWKKQLEDKYAKEPVFALISGYGDWQVIHHFCEENKIPSIFPITNTPVVSEKNIYTLYFSKGIQLDAQAVAEHIIDTNKHQKTGNILQLYNNDPMGSLAEKTLRNRLKDKKIVNIDSLKIPPSKIITANELETIRKKYKPSTLVIWLGKKQTLQILSKKKIAKTTYVSSRMTNQLNPGFSDKVLTLENKDTVYIVHPFYIKKQHPNHLLRTKMWARLRKINYDEERIIANTYFSLAIVTGAIHNSRYNLNRDYLMEQFEHMVDNTVYHSVYPHLSLGPDQRYASKGTYLISAAPSIKTQWIIPDF